MSNHRLIVASRTYCTKGCSRKYLISHPTHRNAAEFCGFLRVRSACALISQLSFVVISLSFEGAFRILSGELS